jgi:hypothetical protein
MGIGSRNTGGSDIRAVCHSGSETIINVYDRPHLLRVAALTVSCCRPSSWRTRTTSTRSWRVLPVRGADRGRRRPAAARGGRWTAPPTWLLTLCGLAPSASLYDGSERPRLHPARDARGPPSRLQVYGAPASLLFCSRPHCALWLSVACGAACSRRQARGFARAPSHHDRPDNFGLALPKDLLGPLLARRLLFLLLVVTTTM